MLKLFAKVAFAVSTMIAGWSLSLGEAVADQIGMSKEGQLDLQEPATLIARQTRDLHHLMLVICAAICAFVLLLLLIVVVRYNRRANPTPARWTHNSVLEVAWTAVPIVILIVIALPSIRLLQLQEDFDRFEPDIVIKATGNQWFWSYDYVDDDIRFDSLMIAPGHATMNDTVRAELAEAGYPEDTWKLATDTAMVVPVNQKVLMQITANDVIHAWAVPAFGVKADGMPGRHNRQWFEAEEEGIYFGQCSELCGKDHAYMPITVKVVSQGEYDAWKACVLESDVYSCPVKPMVDMLVSEADDAADDAAGDRVAQTATE